MKKRFARYFLAVALSCVILCGSVPHRLGAIYAFSPVQEAQAQEGGGPMQNMLPFIMMMMMMMMMMQRQNNDLQGEQGERAAAATANLLTEGQPVNQLPLIPGLNLNNPNQ